MSSLRRVLHIPDSHWPFVDKQAWSLMLRIAQDFKPQEVVILGDLFDFYSVSRHEKDPFVDFKSWKDEMKECREAFPQILNLKAQKYVFLEGNHELRLQKNIAEKCPKLSGIYQTKELLHIPNDWLYLPYGQEGHYKIGNLTCCHGARAGENPAASMVKKYRSSVLFGHTHKLQEYHIVDIHGKDFVGINAGWLGDQKKAAAYIKDVSDWSLGFAVTWHNMQKGNFFYQLIHIKKGPQYEAFFNGRVYSG